MCSVESILFNNVHTGLSFPTQNGVSYLVKGSYKYYHYGCDKFLDKGWGCGYRTLQTICSWIQNTLSSSQSPPNIPNIQKLLVEIEDKPNQFIGSKDWIGSVEICLVIDKLYDVPCKIIHVHSGRDLHKHVQQLIEHFQIRGGPVMMGGDRDCSSKGIVGVHVATDDTFLLVVDPHFIGNVKSAEQLQNDSWVKWQKLSEFVDSSFYNFCLPQLTFQEFKCGEN